MLKSATPRRAATCHAFEEEYLTVESGNWSPTERSYSKGVILSLVAKPILERLLCGQLSNSF